MGMLDPKEYLTGTDGKGAVQAGEVFRIHNAKITGIVHSPNGDRTEVKLLISTESRPEPFVVYATNAGIVGAIQRTDSADRHKMADGGMMVKLATKDTGKDNPAYILVGPDQPAVIPAGGAEDTPDF